MREEHEQEVLQLVHDTALWHLTLSWRAFVLFLAILGCLNLLEGKAGRLQKSTHRHLTYRNSDEIRTPQTIEEREAEGYLLDLVARRTNTHLQDHFERQTSTENSVSAILLSSDRPRSLALVLRSIVLHSFIKEVIIWVNNPHTLNTSELGNVLLETSAELRVIDSPGNLGDLSRYAACTLAVHSTCYLASAKWLNPAIDSTFAFYREIQGRQNGLIVGVAPVTEYWRDRRWTFTNLGIGLHAGHANTQHGAFVPRDLAVKFMTQLSLFSPLLPRNRMMECDAYFAIWANQIHHELPMELLPVNLDGLTQPIRPSETAQTFAFDAVKRLYDVMLSERRPASPVSSEESDIRAACHNDRCLFFTSMCAFEDAPMSASKEDGQEQQHARDLSNRQHMRKRSSHTSKPFNPHNFRSLHDYVPYEPFPQLSWWLDGGAYNFAVDGTLPGVKRPRSALIAMGRASALSDHENGTCWTSAGPPQAGDYFGLRLTPTRPSLHELSLVGSLDLANIAAEKDNVSIGWEVWTLSDGSPIWDLEQPVRSPSVMTIPGTTKLVRVTVELRASQTAFEIEPAGLLKLKLVSRGIQSEPLTLCGWSLDGWSV